MFLSRNKKNNLYPCKPQFYYKKWGLRGSKLYSYVFLMVKKNTVRSYETQTSFYSTKPLGTGSFCCYFCPYKLVIQFLFLYIFDISVRTSNFKLSSCQIFFFFFFFLEKYISDVTQITEWPSEVCNYFCQPWLIVLSKKLSFVVFFYFKNHLKHRFIDSFTMIQQHVVLSNSYSYTRNDIN